MSHAISPEDLHDTAEPYGSTPFLLYTGSNGSPRAIHVVAELTNGDTQAVVRGFGRGLAKILTSDMVLSLLWPPHTAGDFSLIADATGVIGNDGETLMLEVSGAVLHRPAPADGDGSC